MSSSISSSLPHKTVLIYRDVGANEGSCLALMEALSIYFRNVTFVSAHHLKTASWEERTSLLVIGGGRCGIITAALGDIGQKKIEAYIKIFGGKLLGVCAGFYYLPKFSFYHYKDEHYDSKRDYPLIDGYAKGPLTPPDVAGVVQIYTSGGKSGGCYAQGNPVFCASASTSIISIIGTYELPDDSPEPNESIAIAVFQSGAGCVAGSGVHLEFKAPRTRSPFESEEMSCLFDRMTEAENFRISTLEDLLGELFPGALIEPLSAAEYDDADLSPRRFGDRDDSAMVSPAGASMASSATLSVASVSRPSRSSCLDLEGLEDYYTDW